jgi:Ion channel
MPLRPMRQPSFVLLCGLAAILLSYPFLETSPLGRELLAAVGLVVLVLCVRVVGVGPRRAWAGWALAGIAIAANAAYVAWDTPVLGLQATIAYAIFYAYAIVSLVAYVLRDDVATYDELFAAVCLYIFIAMFWACLYWIVKYFQPGAFYVNEVNNVDGRMTWWDLLYFSFTTLTSTGYGEITPVSSHARSLVMLQQVTGVMYVALLVARLANMPSRRLRR